MLPDAAVGRVNGAGPIIPCVVADRRGDGFLEVEGWQSGNLGREIIIRGALAANRCNGQDQVSDPALFLESAALAKEETGLRLDRAQQVHDGGGVSASHPKVDERNAFRCDGGHGLAFAADGNVEPFRERVQVRFEVDEQNVFAEILEGCIGIARQPVMYDLFFCFHRDSKR